MAAAEAEAAVKRREMVWNNMEDVNNLEYPLKLSERKGMQGTGTQIDCLLSFSERLQERLSR